MVEKIITCITCPIGCDIVVSGEGDGILSMKGNQCKRGEEYASKEFMHPVRILTTTVKVNGADTPLLPIRSDKPVPQELLMQCMDEIRNVRVTPPISRYDVIIAHILGTDVNIVATGEVK